MSLSDGFKANHGENGFLGVTSDGHGVYHREETSRYPERVVLLDITGTTVEEHELDSKAEAFEYVTENYEWEEFSDDAKEYLNRVDGLDHVAV